MLIFALLVVGVEGVLLAQLLLVVAVAQAIVLAASASLSVMATSQTTVQDAGQETRFAAVIMGLRRLSEDALCLLCSTTGLSMICPLLPESLSEWTYCQCDGPIPQAFVFFIPF